MKELLPIIFAIAYFAFKQYKKGQDGKAVSHPHNGRENVKEAPQAASPTLDDFITSFFGEQGLKPEVESKLNFSEEKFNSADENLEFDSNEKEILNEVQGPYSIDYNDNTSEVFEDEDQFEMIKNKEPKSSQSIDFDLRNAVIYDAILNPPYISR